MSNLEKEIADEFVRFKSAVGAHTGAETAALLSVAAELRRGQLNITDILADIRNQLTKIRELATDNPLDQG